MDKVVLLLSLVSGCLLLETGVVWASPTKSDTNEMGQSQYRPGYLLSLGQSLNSPLLKLIGLTLCNVKPSPCSDWSQWSQCSGIIGRFGIRNRTRQCGDKDWGCRENSMKPAQEEIERSLCESLCPSDYNQTQHGFCVKYMPVSMDHSTAVKRCQEDGAYVMNVNSNDKEEYINGIYNGRAIWVDGNRASTTSPWTYTYGESPASMNWARQEPGNAATELCMVYSSDFKRHGVSCTPTYHVVCEKVAPV